MSKAIKYSLIGILLIGVIGGFIFTFTIDSIVKSGIENIGSEMTGTVVTVDGVSISMFSGSGTISGLSVANPDGFEKEYAFTADEISIELDVWSLFSDEILVHRLDMTSPTVLVEQQMPDNNLRTIMNSINENASEDPSESTMVIELFRMTDGKADLYTEVGGERSAQVEISEVELTDVGGKETRQSVEEVIQIIAERVIDNSLRAAAESGAEQIRDAIRDFLN